MKICFISNVNINIGSYRIWINDLNYNLNQLGYNSKINPENIEEYNIIIFGKNSDIDNKLPIFHKKYKNKKYGYINPPNENKNFYNYLDFFIVGSIEEKDSLLKYNKNIFIYPLIENMYLNVNKKIHIDKNEIIIGYHGNPVHLNSLKIGFNPAIEKLKKIYNIKLLCITNSLNYWKQENRPNINIEFIKWNIKTIKEDLLKIDIGIIPNITYTNKDFLDNKHEIGMYSSDKLIRFKNKSNNGRSLVFFQLGIPVIADYTPSNMHILGNENNGYAVLSKEAWYYALEKLINCDHRNKISQNAYNVYKKLYDPLVWTTKIYNEINSLVQLN